MIFPQAGAYCLFLYVLVSPDGVQGTKPPQNIPLPSGEGVGGGAPPPKCLYFGKPEASWRIVFVQISKVLLRS